MLSYGKDILSPKSLELFNFETKYVDYFGFLKLPNLFKPSISNNKFD